jgi:hypothetical protein
MPTSQARIDSNRINSQRSTGPTSEAGKQRSRMNGLKHGLTGAGIVLAEQDISEVETRDADLQAEFAPRSAMGKILVRRMATLSVRMERAEKQETAATARRVLHAVDDFDRGRLDDADRLLDLLGEEPRVSLRTLRKSPEGVDRLIVAWHELRDDLIRDPKPTWTAGHRERAENLTGLRVDEAIGSRINVLSKAAWGDFGDWGIPEDDEVDFEVRKAEARGLLVELIDAEIAELEAHYETLDFETLELDRAQAPDIALFDPSREATLARRYEAEASRGFFKAWKELRQAEAEAAARPSPVATPEVVGDCVPLASSCERPSAAPREPRPEPEPPRPRGDRAVGSLDPSARGPHIQRFG